KALLTVVCMVPHTHINTGKKLLLALSTALVAAACALLAAHASALTSVTDNLASARQPVDLLSEPHTVTLMNDTRTEMHFGSAQIPGAQPRDFRIERDGCSRTTLSPNGRCTLQVRFAPHAAGLSNAELTVPHRDDAGSFSAPLSGSGFVIHPVAPPATPPSTDTGQPAPS